MTFQLHHCRKISDDLLKSKTFFFIFSSKNCFYCINLALFFCKNKVKTASCEHFITRPNDSVYICFLYKFQSSVGYNPSHMTHPTHVLFPQSEMMFKKKPELVFKRWNNWFPSEDTWSQCVNRHPRASLHLLQDWGEMWPGQLWGA